MLGLGLGHYIPLVAYLGFWAMVILSLTGRPQWGLYYMLPFLPYRTMRDHFLQFPLGANVLVILILAVIVGAVLKGKRLPKSNLYVIWILTGIYLYLSMWVGTVRGIAPAPLWLSDINFLTWKDYMVIPMVFAAAGMLIEDRKAIRTVIIIIAVALLFIDRSCLLESMTRTWSSFDEDKRGGGPLGYGSNQTAAFLAQFAMFFWGFAIFLKKVRTKVLCYILVSITVFAAMYTFSRGAYLAMLFGVFVLGITKDRKLLILLAVFLATWQAIVPVAVRERVTMTRTADGRLESSAEERVELWTNAESVIENYPILGTGYATFQLGQHVDGLKDTHNWYVKVMVESGIIGLSLAVALVGQLLALSFRLFRRASDPLYRGLGLGLLAATCSCLVANCFGDRWTYIEITALLWVLAAAAIRALQFTNEPQTGEVTERLADRAVNPYLVYR